MAGSRARRSKSPPKPPSFMDEYMEHIRTPAAILLADGTLVLLGVFILAVVRIGLRGFLALGTSANVIDRFEVGDIYLMIVLLFILGLDTLVKIIAFVRGGHKK